MKWTHLFSVLFILPASAFAMADHSAPVYGVPTLYGEYEVGADDISRARAMYGDAPRPQPIRAAAADKIKTPVAKQPTKAVKVAPKKNVKKKKSAGTVKQKSAKAAVAPIKVMEAKVELPPVEIDAEVTDIAAPVADVAVPVAPAPVIAPQPDASAANIAGALSNKVDLDSFCTMRTATPGKNIPDGYVLMPGRPDLMSCRGAE